MLWMCIVALVQADRGVAAVAAMDLVWHPSEWGSSTGFGHVLALLAWHSLGLAVGISLAGSAFQLASGKCLLMLALLADALALGMMWLARPGTLLTACLRFISGASSALPLVYLPLWVDEFGPSDAAAQWMNVMQSGAPAGQLLGLLVAGGATVYGLTLNAIRVDWHLAFLLQAVLMLPTILRVALIPSMQVDVANVTSMRARVDSLTPYPAEGLQLNYFQGNVLHGVNRSPVTVALSITLCLMQATAAGLSLWAAPYVSTSPGAPDPMAALLFVAVSLVAAPSLGTLAGAVLCDKLDGFKAGHHAAALRVACGFVTIAACAGPLSQRANTFGERLTLIWFWLFGAGAFLPISTGVLMTSMPSYLRSFHCSASTLGFHSISFTAVPAAIVVLMSFFSDPTDGLMFGVCFALWLTVPAALLLVVACVREPKCAAPAGLSGVDDLTFSDISYELSRRRMSTAPL